MENQIKCKKCHISKPIVDFFPSMVKKSIFVCGKCVCEKRKSFNKIVEKKCKKCKTVKPIDSYGRHANGSRRAICEECYDTYTPIEIKQRNKLSLERHRESDRKYKEKRALNEILVKTAKQRAKSKNIDFNLEIKDVVIPVYCPILGIKLNQVKKGSRQHTSPSLDRIDNKKGYTKDNIKVISWEANTIKNHGTADEHQKIVYYIHENQPSQIEYYI